jgi:hypothetical protein
MALSWSRQLRYYGANATRKSPAGRVEAVGQVGLLFNKAELG